MVALEGYPDFHNLWAKKSSARRKDSEVPVTSWQNEAVLSFVWDDFESRARHFCETAEMIRATKKTLVV